MSMRSQDRHTGPRARTVRGIDDALWQAVQDKARARGTSASAVIRALLTHWVATDVAERDADEETGPVLAGRLNAPQEAADACSRYVR